jgi:hypothetical protein
MSNNARYPSVANEHKFSRPQPGYSFSETAGTRIDPTFVRMQQAPTNGMYPVGSGRINAFTYQRPPMTMCRGLRSMAISCIVHGVLMIAYNAIFFGLGVPETVFSATKAYGFWGGLAAIIGGSLALVGWSKSQSVSPLSSFPGFVAIAVSQLIALAITLAAATFASRAFRIYVLLPVMNLDHFVFDFSTSVSGIFVEWSFYLNILGTAVAWGPVGCLVWTFRHTLTAAIDVFSL